MEKGYNKYDFDPYLLNDVLKRSYRPFTKEMCIRIVENQAKKKKQKDGRFRFWGKLKEYQGKWVRVVTLENQKTIFNIFFDEDFKR